MKTAEETVEMLNTLLELDPVAVALLIENKVACNKELAESPDITAGVRYGGYVFGALGLLNGVYGGRIRAEYAVDSLHVPAYSRLIRFYVDKGGR